MKSISKMIDDYAKWDEKAAYSFADQMEIFDDVEREMAVQHSRWENARLMPLILAMRNFIDLVDAQQSKSPLEIDAFAKLRVKLEEMGNET